MKKNKTILLISPEGWNGHFVSKHHYAITLAKQGYEVYFLSPPDNSLENIIIEKTKHPHLWSVLAPQVTKGLRFYPKILRIFLERKWLKKFESKIDKKVTTVWLFENSRFYNMEFAEQRIKIYHQVDSNQNFHIKEASASADICFCTTDFIQRELTPFNDIVYKVHHGVSKVKPLDLSTAENERFLNSKVNVVYVGNLDISFFDLEIFLKLVKKFPEINFHLLGHYNQEKVLFKSTVHFSNIIWWGRVESTLIPAVLNCCDIQMLLYKADNQLEKEQLASPHKIMEYLASGKVTIATYTDEYKDKRNLIEMVDDSKDYMNKFEKIVQKISYYNSEKKKNERISFAEEHSYEHQLEKIIFLINKNNLKGL